MTALRGKHVIITGGSQGIGLATAAACQRNGARVSVIARDSVRLASVQSMLPGLAVASADVTDPGTLAHAIEHLEATHGPCDVLVTAAGAAVMGAGRVLAIDTVPERLEMARAAGAETLDFASVDIYDAIQQRTHGRRGVCVHPARRRPPPGERRQRRTVGTPKARPHSRRNRRAPRSAAPGDV